MREYGISEILEQTTKFNDEQDKIEVLRRNDGHALRMVLQFALDSRVEWLLPEGPVPYKPSVALDSEGRLKQEAKRFYLFVSQLGVPMAPNLKARKREELYVQMLESIHPADARLMVAVKDKKIPYQGVTAELIEKAFPNLHLVYNPTITTEE